jgi:hypothetical protein
MDQIINALHLHNWYAFAALALTLAVQLFRKAPKSSELWAKIPDGWRWLIPVVSGAVTGFTQAYAAGLSFGTAALAAFGGAIGISIPAMGLNSLLTEAPVRWNGGAGGAPIEKPPIEKPARMFPSVPPMGMLMLVVCFAVGFVGCASWKAYARTVDDAAVILCDAFFAGQRPGLSLEDIEKGFCSTAEQVAPFLASAKVAVAHGGAVRMQRVEK